MVPMLFFFISVVYFYFEDLSLKTSIFWLGNTSQPEMKLPRKRRDRSVHLVETESERGEGEGV